MGDVLARWLYARLEKMKRLPESILYGSSVREDLRTLEPAKNTAKRQKEYVLGKLSLCSMIVIIGVVLGIITWINEASGTKIVDNRIYRGEYGDGLQEIEVIADNGEDSRKLTLEVSEKVYNKKEIGVLLEAFIPELENVILGENESLDRVEYDLVLTDSIEGYPFEIDWLVDEIYLDYEGRLQQETLEKPQVTGLIARIYYEDFSAEYELVCQIYSKAQKSPWHEKILSGINEKEQESIEKEYIELPENAGNMQLEWRYQTSHNGILYLCITPVIAVVLFCAKDRDLHKLVEDRCEQMQMDYPELVSSFALLTGAGMTVPNAWNKIVRDYTIKKQHTGKKRFAYEEMLLTLHEMESGVSQAKAYENFGRRCRMSSYNKLATLLSQNLKKGAVNLPALLKSEAYEAFNERKHIARKLGEKAGTKLLGPMLMLLAMVMVIIILPVFMKL